MNSMFQKPPLPTTPPYDARLVIERFQRTAPVDVNKLADELGVRVWEFTNFPPTTSGKLFRDIANGGSSGFSIGVNATEAFTRKRFTIAHELAHFILHKDQIATELSDDTYYRSGLSNKEEREANQLAADILMPFPLIRQLQASGFTNVDGLAKKLRVSVLAMKIRLGVPVL